MKEEGLQRREALLKQQVAQRNKIDSLDKKLGELKFLYEQYFIGLEKVEPLELREEVQELVKELTMDYIKSTATKFKLNSMIAKYNSYARLWDRTRREIEEGRYKRDIFRIKVKDWQFEFRKKKEEEKAKASSKKSPLDSLFDIYLDSRKKNKEPIEGLTKEKFAEKINAQVLEIKKKFNCKEVSFRVLVENGKTKLKAQPKK